MSNYATKTELKNVTHVDTSSFALKTNLANLKTKVDKVDIDKLVPVPVDLNKLSDVVKNDVVKTNAYDKLVAKVNNIDTSDFVLKTKYNADKTAGADPERICEFSKFQSEKMSTTMVGRQRKFLILDELKQWHSVLNSVKYSDLNIV